MNILLVSEDKTLAESLKEKLVFLRKDDNITTSSYKDAPRNIELVGANIILIHENSDSQKSINLIKKLRKNKNLCLILICNTYNRNLILSAADAGVDDFILSSSEDFEFVIRIVDNIKHASIKLLAERNTKLLEQIKVIDELTGLYNYSYSKQVIENTIDTNLIKNASFMVISPSNNGKTKFSSEDASDAIKQSIRTADIASLGKGINFYIFMPETDINGAVVVLNKIKEKIKFDICAGITNVSEKDFNTFERQALKAVADAVATDADFIFAEDEKAETLDEWLDNGGIKGYKIFRQMFNKKLEKVITPVFYRLQKAYEEKLFDTTIEQRADSEQCVFSLKNRKNTSFLKILYPGFSKIIISIEHEGLDSPENREIQLQLSQITQNELIEIVENFIKEFKATC